MLTTRAPFDVRYEMLGKPVEGIWPSPQKGHSASTAFAMSSILSIGGWSTLYEDETGQERLSLHPVSLKHMLGLIFTKYLSKRNVEVENLLN